jgi:hypothetical protein
MAIAAIHENVLTRRVPGLAREKEDGHCRDFVHCGHPLSQGNLGEYRTQLFLGIWKSIQPLAVKRGHDFRRKNGVDANLVRQQLGCPFAGEGHDCAF